MARGKPGSKHPGRLNPSHDDRTRAKIKASQLINRLYGLANGTVDNMPPHAVTAAVALLRKVLPDLAAVEHSGEIATPYALVLPMAETAEAWETECKPLESKDIN